MLNQRPRECTPQRKGFPPQLVAAALVAVAAASPAPAHADAAPVRDPALAESADLDGHYLSLGPRGGAIYSEGEWDGAFGGEASFYRHRGGRPLSILGASGGMIQLSELDGGHAFGEIGAGGQLGLGLRVGLGFGITARLSPTRHTRWGGHATLWGFAGAIPYVRAGILQDTGMFVDLGIRLALPTVRW